MCECDGRENKIMDSYSGFWRMGVFFFVGGVGVGVGVGADLDERVFRVWWVLFELPRAFYFLKRWRRTRKLTSFSFDNVTMLVRV